MSRLAICLPQTDNVRAEYALALAGMMLRLGNVPCGMNDVVTVAGSGSILPSVRQGIAERSIELYKATHLLWIDADHHFPADTAHRLVAHQRPWVGINATTRRIPLRETAVNSKLELVTTGPHEKGIERVHRMGFGIALIEARVFEAMEKPWFLVEYVESEDGPTFRGEDIYFCEKARAAGFAPMVDHDLTKETTHIGAVGFNSAMLDEATQTNA
jgi:hypothetical protein